MAKTSDDVNFAFQSKRGRPRKKNQFEAKRIKLENPPEGEDKTSFERHNQRLLKECKGVFKFVFVAFRMCYYASPMSFSGTSE